MDSIHIHGGVCLQGKVRIQGSKNAALPVLAATILTKGINLIHNCPKIADVYLMLELLRSLGCVVSWEEDGVRVDARNAAPNKMPVSAIKGMRSSLCLLGALLGEAGEVAMEYPGGCVIGERPIDLHLAAFRSLGAEFREENGIIYGNAGKGLMGAHIDMPRSSVGATENTVLAAVSAEGVTVLTGAAREPEVETLCKYLCRCGAQIEGIGTDRLVIVGGRRLSGTEFGVPADRIVAGTYLLACLGTGGAVLLEDAPVSHMEAVVGFACRMGAECQEAQEGLYVQAPGRLLSCDRLTTEIYPGFPTDLQSVALVVMTAAEGKCLIEETIFENRFRILEPLRRMGGKVRLIDAGKAEVEGPVFLNGTETEAWELRGGAALVTAGLMADGETIVKGCDYIDRGYENICRDLRELGARIYRV